jgi:hypothetical protein
LEKENSTIQKNEEQAAYKIGPAASVDIKYILIF